MGEGGEEEAGRVPSLRQLNGSPRQKLASPEIWTKNNIKVSITKETCTTIDFTPPLKKILGRKPETEHLKFYL